MKIFLKIVFAILLFPLFLILGLITVYQAFFTGFDEGLNNRRDIDL